MKLIELRGVTVDLPVYGASSRSIRRAVLNLSTGGRLMRDTHHHMVIRALDGVSFSMNDGDRLGLIGHNGSGKSTLLRVLAGIYPPSSGYLSVNGEISSVLDLAAGLDFEATGEENIRFLARYRGRSQRDVIDSMDEIADFSELGAYLQMPVKTYSQGMLARLIFATATSFKPEILVMDEWIAAGDAAFIAKAQARLESLVSSSRAFVLASHSHDIIGRFCNKVAVMDHGKLVAFGPTEEVMYALAHSQISLAS
jgi:ABC-type polysaccharide/polyol phosphate transport system ATPase subunit